MKYTRVVNKNAGISIEHSIRKAMGIEPGDLIEVDIVRVVKKADEMKQDELNRRKNRT